MLQGSLKSDDVSKSRLGQCRTKNAERDVSKTPIGIPAPFGDWATQDSVRGAAGGVVPVAKFNICWRPHISERAPFRS